MALLRRPGYQNAVVAGLVGWIVAGATSVFWNAALDADQQRHMDSFGQAVVAQLATLSAEPMIGGDRISLSVLAARMNEPAEVAAVRIYTIDNRVIAMAGSAPGQAPQFTQSIVFEDTVAGYAQVALSRREFQTGPSSATLSLWIAASGVAAMLFGYLTGQLRRGMAQRATATAPARLSASEASSVPEVPGCGYILVANWFNQVSFAPADRARILEMCLSHGDQVGGLYGGIATELSGTGLSISFQGASADELVADRCFEVLCAGLLIAEVLSELNNRHYMQGRGTLAFRFGLHEDPSPSSSTAERVSDAILLSAVAGDGTVATSCEVFGHLEHPERFATDTQQHAILTSLATATAGRCVVVSSLRDSYRSLIDEQAERLTERLPDRLTAQDDSTLSPSAF